MRVIPSLQDSRLANDKGKAMAFLDGKEAQSSAGASPVHHYAYVDSLGILSTDHVTVDTGLREVLHEPFDPASSTRL